jgi:AraC-like DNA-binding protein
MLVNGESGVRPAWMFEFAHVCQRFVGHVLELDIEQFPDVMARLQRSLPEPRSALEWLIARDYLVQFATKSAEIVHSRYHRQFPTIVCPGCPIRDTAQSLSGFESSPHEVLCVWASAFTEKFRRTHQTPAVDRAAAILRRSFIEQVDLATVTREVGCGRTRLLRDFRAAFGTSMGGYRTRVRLRHAVQALREPGSKIDVVARAVGYHSPKNFNRALMTATALTPSGIRRLTIDDAARLLMVPLALYPRLDCIKTK